MHGRLPRYIEPNSTLEIVSRTIMGLFLLLPSDQANELIRGVLDYSLAKFPGIRMHAFVFLSNHYHLVLTAADAQPFPISCVS